MRLLILYLFKIDIEMFYKCLECFLLFYVWQ